MQITQRSIPLAADRSVGIAMFKRLVEMGKQLMTLTLDTQGNNSIAPAPPDTTSIVIL